MRQQGETQTSEFLRSSLLSSLHSENNHRSVHKTLVIIESSGAMNLAAINGDPFIGSINLMRSLSNESRTVVNWYDLHDSKSGCQDCRKHSYHTCCLDHGCKFTVAEMEDVRASGHRQLRGKQPPRSQVQSSRLRTERPLRVTTLSCTFPFRSFGHCKSSQGSLFPHTLGDVAGVIS